MGGVMIVGYEMMRNLCGYGCIASTPSSASGTEWGDGGSGGGWAGDTSDQDSSYSMYGAAARALIDPGPDLLIVDESHTIRNHQVANCSMGLA
jgi:hypothetical protein